MKVPALRRGNSRDVPRSCRTRACLNESPRPKAGKSGWVVVVPAANHASMKVPALRRGNFGSLPPPGGSTGSLNESPRPKAGKLITQAITQRGRGGLNESPRPKAGKL